MLVYLLLSVLTSGLTLRNLLYFRKLLILATLNGSCWKFIRMSSRTPLHRRNQFAETSSKQAASKQATRKQERDENCNFYVLHSYHCHKNECIKIISKVINNFVAKSLCICKLLLLRPFIHQCKVLNL